MSWVIADLAKIESDSYIQDREAELIKLSSDINFYQMEASNKIARLDMEYFDENLLIEEQYEGELEGLDATSSEYVSKSQEKLSAQQDNDNDHTAQVNAIQNECDRKVNPLQVRQEMIQAQLSNDRAQYNSFREATNKNVEEECAYFSGN